MSLFFNFPPPDAHQALINLRPTRTVAKQLLSAAAEVSACAVHVCGGGGVCAEGGWYWCVCVGRMAAVRTDKTMCFLRSLLRKNVLQTQDPRCSAIGFILINPEVATVTCQKKCYFWLFFSSWRRTVDKTQWRVHRNACVMPERLRSGSTLSPAL